MEGAVNVSLKIAFNIRFVGRLHFRFYYFDDYTIPPFSNGRGKGELFHIPSPSRGQEISFFHSRVLRSPSAAQSEEMPSPSDSSFHS